MPNYNFQCKKCELIFDENVPYDATNKYKTVICPECGSKRKEKLATACNFNFSNPVGTGRWNNDRTGHDYRYKYNQPNVRAEREMAENRSHMGSGSDIYRQIDDTNNDNNFDFGKI